MWKNRIVRSGEADPSDLLANPFNFRIHPRHQQDAMEKVLDEVGWVQDVIVNQNTNTVIDGHLRVKLALRRDAETIPVKYVDLTEAEEQLILYTFDQLTGLAAIDTEMMSDLYAQIEAVDESGFLRELAESEGAIIPDFAPTEFEKQPRLDEKSTVFCPECGHEF